MPIEVLTREDIEKLVEEKLKKLLTETEIWKKVTELELTTAKIKDDIAKVSAKEPNVAEPERVAAALKIDLADRADLLQIGTPRDSATLKPKGYLRTQDFKPSATQSESMADSGPRREECSSSEHAVDVSPLSFDFVQTSRFYWSLTRSLGSFMW